MSGRRLSQLAHIPVGELDHVTEQNAVALAAYGVESVFDLLTTYPRRYVDRTKRVDLSDLTVGEEVAVLGVVGRVGARRTRQGRALVDLTVADDGDTFSVVFFNQSWRARQLAVGTQALFFGKVTEYRGRPQMTNPLVDVLVGVDGAHRDTSRIGRVVPIYPASGKAGLTSWEVGGFVEEALDRAKEFVDPVPGSVLDRLGLLDRTRAFHRIHLPAHVGEWPDARRRLAFDELLRLQVLLALRRRRAESAADGVAHPARAADLTVAPGALAPSLVGAFLSGHRFALTGAQRRVLAEIFDDLAAPRPMHRLLQGDVGSGKTVVALAALLAVVEGGRQGAVMAPTEVLAEQHYRALRDDLARLTVPDTSTLEGERPVRVAIVSGRSKARDRAATVRALVRGDIDIVVGTHALLSADVRFRALGLVVIDEQHRFGVEQRAALREKGRAHSDAGRDPDLLVMTATPIPRTAAMVLFSDLDLSTLDEMPSGRVAPSTAWLRGPLEAGLAWAAVRDAASRGERAFVVCPLVEGSDRVEASSAVREHERLSSGELAGLRVGLLHAQMPVSDQDSVMARFRAGDLDVLVATVIIEVGVDVPAATVMVIEDAWRFGLAQLHQLRGRIGRGGGASHCFVLGEPPSADGVARLEAIVATTDGFALAEIDLDLRGEGTLLGARQRGRSDLVLARLRTDGDLLAAAHDASLELVGADATLAAHPELRDELELFVDDEEREFLFKS